jgi:molybdopterin converting factor small subunit
MKTVIVQYFAILRERSGRSEESIQPGALTAADLFGELDEQYRFGLPAGAVKVAVNEDFADWTAPLAEGDRIVFIPPVAGG